MMTSDARRTREIKSRMVITKAAFNKKKTVFTSNLNYCFKEKLVKCYIGSSGFYNAESWALRSIDQVYLEGFEMWCCRRMEISWTDHVRNVEVLHRVEEERNIIHTYTLR
jgi:Leu/Phe-tRNA-protein transferase